MNGGLIVASARLPVTLSRRSDGWEAIPSVGGLVAALGLVMERSPFQWLGWPGTFVPDSEQGAVVRELQRHRSRPVFIAQDDIEGFYQSFSNQTLWPLLHNRLDRTRFEVGGWSGFHAANSAFCAAILKVATEDDVVWVHDYQLSLVPQMLRTLGAKFPIGFFLHTPFPPADTFRHLPQRAAMLEGILGADLVGFQSHEYAGHFRQASVRLVGASCCDEGLQLRDRFIDVATLPIGIDPQEIRELAGSRGARQELSTLQTTYAGRKIIAGVDRFDYTKGIPEKLRAFEALLERYPRLRQRVVLIQVTQPSRTTVGEYQQLKREVDELVGRINGRFGSSSFMPVVHVNQTMSRERIVGLYRAADYALVTPLADGMNLVALEYVAARGDRGGILILSEFTGAAQFLSGARLVNPHDSVRTADILAECLDTPPQATDSFASMRRYVTENTVSVWAEAYVEKLKCSGKARVHEVGRFLAEKSPFVARLATAGAPIVVFGDSAILDPDGLLLDASVAALIALSRNIDTYGVSRKSLGTIDAWNLPTTLNWLAQWGTAHRVGGEGWAALGVVDSAEIRELTEPVLKEFVRHTPGSALCYKSGSAIWHCSGANPQFAALQSSLLIPILEERLRGHPYVVERHRRSVEIRHSALSMQEAVSRLSTLRPTADWLLFFGDPAFDSALFAAIGATFSDRVLRISVAGPSRIADAWLDGSDELCGALAQIGRIRLSML